MSSWEHGATFLAFALIAAILVFSGVYHHGGSALHGNAEVAAVEK
jgi:hypothetical protein